MLKPRDYKQIMTAIAAACSTTIAGQGPMISFTNVCAIIDTHAPKGCWVERKEGGSVVVHAPEEAEATLE